MRGAETISEVDIDGAGVWAVGNCLAVQDLMQHVWKEWDRSPVHR
jgi:hypothetical protein